MNRAEALVTDRPAITASVPRCARANWLPLTTEPSKSKPLRPVLHQVRGAAVEFVGPPLDLGKHIGDPGQVLESPATAFDRGRRLRCSIGTARCRGARSAHRRGRLGVFVGVDGQVAVRAEVPRDEVADAAGQLVRGQPLQGKGR